MKYFKSFCTLPSTGGCALGMDTVHQNQHTLPLPQHRERLHSKRRKKIRHWRRKQRKINSGLANKNASDLSTSSDSDSGFVQFLLYSTHDMNHSWSETGNPDLFMSILNV